MVASNEEHEGRPCGIVCPSLEKLCAGLDMACNSFETAVRIQRQLESSVADTGEVLEQWGDAETSIMQVLIDSAQGKGGQKRWTCPDPAVVQGVWKRCWNACTRYEEALSCPMSLGSDKDTYLSLSRTITEFLDWFLPPSIPPEDQPFVCAHGIDVGSLLQKGTAGAQVVVGLDPQSGDGMIALAELQGLEARALMLQKEGLAEMAKTVEAISTAKQAVNLSRDDAEVWATAGEIMLERGRQILLRSQAAEMSVVLKHWGEARVAATNILQEAHAYFGQAAILDPSEPSLPYNMACTMAITNNPEGCTDALREFGRRTHQLCAGTPGSAREALVAAMKAALEELRADQDFDGVREAGWFVAEMKRFHDFLTA
ncbi:unnamed protein product [Discosporangium mesarthrocarpum]